MRKFFQRGSTVGMGLGTLAVCTAVLAQTAGPSVEVLVQGTAHQALYAVDFEGDRGVAVGAAGELQVTLDGGKTWTASSVETELTLLGVHVDPARIIAVGQGGTVFLRPEGGKWERISAGTEKRLFSVSANAGGLAAAVGEFGLFMISEDGGRVWRSMSLDWMQIGTEGGAEPHLYSVNVAADGAITMVGEFGLVLRSTDRGRRWSLQSKATPSLFAIQIRDDGKGFAVGQDGYAIKTDDGGVNWTCLDLGTKAILTGVDSRPDGKVAVSAMREMLLSSDGGGTWRRVDNPEVTTMWYVDVASPSGEGALMVGQTGRIVKVGT